MITRTREPIDPASVDVTVYHRCPDFATGAALGPGPGYSAWWATATEAGWALQLASPGGRQAELVAAIDAELGESPADRRRRLQDEAAEAID